MKVFKFGGASIKNSSAIMNMAKIITAHKDESLVVVISAMDKTTNALEELLHHRIQNNEFSTQLSKVQKFHKGIIESLFPDHNQDLLESVDSYLNRLERTLELNEEEDFNKLYDATVSTGEYLSTIIISYYLNALGLDCSWVDARSIIRTDSSFREGIVDWNTSRTLIKKTVKDSNSSIIITQGFVAGNKQGDITTLGREGSDFSAAIIASSVNADSVTIWKDVPGILNADPKRIPNATLFRELPYTEASEMTYYGASVIHPKTIKPLANKRIPLYVKSFDHPEQPGTIIHKCKLENTIPCIIFKENQCLFSFKVRDFTFVNEENLSKIFHELHELNIKINMMENSAISFSVVFDYDPIRVELLTKRLKSDYDFRYNKNLTLITLKNSNPELEREYGQFSKVFMIQKSRKNIRYLIAEKQIA